MNSKWRAVIVKKDIPFEIRSDILNQMFNSKPATLKQIMLEIGEAPDLQLLIQSSSGTLDGYSTGRHHWLVYRTYRQFIDAWPELKSLQAPGNESAEIFISKLIALHDIGKSRAMAHEGISLRHEYTLPIAKKF